MAQESWNCDAAEGGGCQQQQESLVPCPNNCGLFGCPATMNLCPKCFGELILTKQGEKVVAAIAASVQKSPTSAAPTTSAPVSLVGKVPEICTSSQASSRVEIRVFPSTDKPVEPMPSPPLLHKSPLPSSHASTLLSLPDLGPLAALFSSDDQKSQPPALKQSVSRCFNCRKRTGLLGFKCRCGYVFCAQHRYSDKHGCSFDYKSAGREAIAKANPIVKASKVEQI